MSKCKCEDNTLKFMNIEKSFRDFWDEIQKLRKELSQLKLERQAEKLGFEMLSSKASNYSHKLYKIVETSDSYIGYYKSNYNYEGCWCWDSTEHTITKMKKAEK